MKIGGTGDDSQDAIARAKAQAEKSKTPSEGKGALMRALHSRSDSVNVGLGKDIQSILDPGQLQTERRARIEELKKLIASGNYNPSSEDVARSISQEITLEILTSGDVANK